MMLAFAAFVLPSQAQLLKVIVEDKALQTQTSIPWQKALEFDDKGVAVLENPEITKRKELLVELEERKEFFFAIVEPGQTLTLTIHLKDNKTQVSYSGKYAAECMYMNANAQFNPITYIPAKPDKPIDFVAAMAQEEADYKALGKMTDIFPVEKQKILTQKHELTHLKNRMTIRKAEVMAQGGNFREDPEYQEMLSQVDINNPKYSDEFFLNSYIYNMMTHDVKREGEVTEETLEYIDLVWKNVPSLENRRSLIGALAYSAFLPEKTIDAQRLWDAVQRLGDEQLNNMFKEVIEKKLLVAKGKKCPDFTFNDVNGKQHHISEFFGKVLYLDYWATWCHPCVWEIPFFEKLYLEYKNDERIQFISFSLDDNVEKWKAKIKKDNPEWAQFILTKSDQQFLKEKMGIVGVPRFIVLNADGTIAEGDALHPSSNHAKAMLEDVLGDAQQSCEVKGTVDGLEDGKMVRLSVAWSDQVLDSTMIKDGKFEFVIPINKTTTQYPLIVAYPGMNDIRLPIHAQLYAEPGAELKVTLSPDHNKTSVIGSPLNFIYKMMTEKYLEKMQKIIALRTAAADESLSEAERAEKDKEANAEQYKIIEFEQQFAEQNLDNIIGINLFAERAVVFDKKDIARMMDEIPAKWDNHPDVIQLRKNQETEAKTAEGEPYVDLTMPDTKGKNVSLSQYIKKNKLTLVDFWASWCGPCRASIPGVKRLYEKYKKQGFGVVGVSLDSKKEAWLKAIQELDLPWPQMSDLKGWDSAASVAYNIKGIPFTLLITQDGIIAGRNIWGEEALEKRVAEILNIEH